VRLYYICNCNFLEPVQVTQGF